MNDTVLPDAADRATALFTDWIEGHHEKVIASFDTTMTAQLPSDQLASAWAQVLAWWAPTSGWASPWSGS